VLPSEIGASPNSARLKEDPLKARTLDIAGTWIEDPRVDEALTEQRQVDPDLWR
jgi:hypothetical protein